MKPRHVIATIIPAVALLLSGPPAEAWLSASVWASAWAEAWVCGGAVLSVGSWAYMLSLFVGAYALAYFFRRFWN